MRAKKDAGCSEGSFDTSDVVPCESYVYDETVVKESLVTSLDLVCEDKSKVKKARHCFLWYKNRFGTTNFLASDNEVELLSS